MSKKHLKSNAVNIILGSAVIAASDSCDFAINQNTTDAAAKDDPGAGMWDNPEATYYDWQVNNESFLVSVSDLRTLIGQAIAGNAVTVKTQIVGDGGSYVRQGSALTTRLSVSSQIDDYVKVTLSFDGASALTSTTATTITPASASREKIRGKALMVAVDTSQTSTPDWHTIACATNHTLEITNQTGDVRCKDINDMAPSKEITGHSVKLTTENLVAMPDNDDTAVFIADLSALIENGKTVKLQFGYYPDAVGAEDEDWGESSVLIAGGDFLTTNLSVNANGVKKDATFKAEFSGKGALSLS